MKGIAVTFEDLSPDQVRAMVDFYEKMKSTPHAAQHTAAPPIVIGESATPQAIARLNELQVPTVPSAPQPATTLKPVAGGSTHDAISSRGGELDKDGVPYNPQFHSSSKRMTAKGQWALRKGVDKDAAAAWAKTPQPAAAYNGPTVHNPMTGQLVPMTGVPELTIPAYELPPVQAAPPPVDYETFANLYGRLGSAGVLTQQIVTEINARVGATTGSDYFHDAGKRAAGYQELLKLAA